MSMAEAEALKKLEDQLNCLVCLNTYTDPKQLHCHHVFCQQCLVRLVDIDQQGRFIVTCPSCRQVTHVPFSGIAGLQSAFHINHLLDILEEHQIAKEKQEKATHYCAHHQKRELELYCETCEKLICFQCTIKEHHGHEYNLEKEVFKKRKQEIVTSLAPAEQQLTAVCNALEQVDTREQEILGQQAALEDAIHKESKQLVDAIKNRTDKHISKLRLITRKKLRVLASQKKQMVTTKTQLSSYLNMVGETLTSGGQQEVIKMKTAVSKRVKELTAFFKLNTLEPNAQADVKFLATSKALEVCQTYGEVGASRSLEPSRCLATGKSLEVATVRERASVTLQAFNFAGEPFEEPIKSLVECKLVSEITGTMAKGNTERSGQSQYKISYQPTIKGRHLLHIKVKGQHIRGSPFSVAIKSTSPVEKPGTSIVTIGGTRKPWGVAISEKQEVMVTEWDRHCVSVFSPSGEKLRSFGTHGSGQSQFNRPAGVAVDGEGNILVVDCWNHRVQKFTADGQFLTAVGTKGSGPLQFFCPEGIAVNRSNNKVYIGDSGNHRVQAVNPDLTFSNTLGSGKGQFDYPRGIACDSTGNVYVADWDNIQVFTAEGMFLRMFGRWGKGRGELNHPVGVAIDTSDMVYVGDKGNHRVCVFTSSGQFVTLFGECGAKSGEFEQPRGVAVDNCGVVYVCDSNNHRVQFL